MRGRTVHGARACCVHGGVARRPAGRARAPGACLLELLECDVHEPAVVVVEEQVARRDDGRRLVHLRAGIAVRGTCTWPPSPPAWPPAWPPRARGGGLTGARSPRLHGLSRGLTPWPYPWAYPMGVPRYGAGRLYQRLRGMRGVCGTGRPRAWRARAGACLEQRLPQHRHGGGVGLGEDADLCAGGRAGE